MDIQWELIKSIFSQYDLELDIKSKIVFVKRPISVENFIYLKRLIMLSSLDIQDIRVTSNKWEEYYEKVRD